MKRIVITLIIGIVIGFILGQVVSPPYQVSSSASPTAWGSIKINRWTGRTWILRIGGSLASPEYYWEEIGEKH